MKRTDPQTVAEIFAETLREGGLEQTYNEQRASYLWPQVVGPQINRCTLRRRVSGGVLHVQLSSAPLKSELAMTKSRLITLLNEAVGAPVITDIIFH